MAPRTLIPFLLALSIANISLAQSASPTTPKRHLPTHDLRLMAFNVWVGGSNINAGRQKIVAAIRAAGADIVAIQESNATSVWVAGQLGWYSYMPSQNGSVALLSRFPITQTFPPTSNSAGAGVRIRLGQAPAQDVIVWSCHLTAYPYGPYQACFDGASVAQVITTQNNTQLPEVQDILQSMGPSLASADDVPVFLMGDFNTPSHLDWVASTSAQHCGYVVPYPVTQAVAAAGMHDAFRSMYPDPALTPGATWSPIFPWNDDEQATEPQDRIDQIYFAGSGVELMDTEVFVTGIPVASPNHASNSWPSDHASVVADFRLRPRAGTTDAVPALSLDQVSYAVGQQIVASFTDGPGNGRDWIGMYPTGEAPGLHNSIAWYYTNNSQNAGAGSGPTTGSVTFGVGSAPTWPLGVGSYSAYFLCCDGYAVAGLPVSFEVQ
ncbi:MAG: endonuclease/exonuclease/phosphatase family metal-dependent hydrolase [Planctomycetota bacterium]|jgi:endonuclease/exonuclease/phosphatase family metal-dependent hydrolase